MDSWRVLSEPKYNIGKSGIHGVKSKQESKKAEAVAEDNIFWAFTLAPARTKCEFV